MAKKANNPAKPNSPRKRTTEKWVQSTDKARPRVIPTVAVGPENDEADTFGPDGLTLRRRLFVEAITGPAFGHATRAAEMAGYAAENRDSLNQTASRLLGIVKVQEAIAHVLAARRLTPEWTRNGIADIAGASMASFLTVGPDGEPKLDWAKASANGAIGHVREWKEEGMDSGSGQVQIIKRSFKLYDRLKALELMAKMQGLVNDKGNAGVTVNVQQMSENDLVRIATSSGPGTAAAGPGTDVADRVR